MLGYFDVGSAANCPARVSILVLLDHAGRRLSFWLANVGADGFRSLFSWIMLGDADPGPTED